MLPDFPFRELLSSAGRLLSWSQWFYCTEVSHLPVWLFTESTGVELLENMCLCVSHLQHVPLSLSPHELNTFLSQMASFIFHNPKFVLCLCSTLQTHWACYWPIVIGTTKQVVTGHYSPAFINLSVWGLLSASSESLCCFVAYQIRTLMIPAETSIPRGRSSSKIYLNHFQICPS